MQQMLAHFIAFSNIGTCIGIGQSGNIFHMLHVGQLNLTLKEYPHKDSHSFKKIVVREANILQPCL